jgi:hypothetical protein
MSSRGMVSADCGAPQFDDRLQHTLGEQGTSRLAVDFKSISASRYRCLGLCTIFLQQKARGVLDFRIIAHCALDPPRFGPAGEGLHQRRARPS